MKEYEELKIDVIEFEETDIIITSGRDTPEIPI